MTITNMKDIIGTRIKEVRLEKNLTQKDVAQRVNVATSTINRYEKGLIENIKIPVVKSIASALGVDPSWLMGYDVPKIPKNVPSPEVQTIAAHHDDEEWSDEELAEIEEFKKYVLSKRKNND